MADCGTPLRAVKDVTVRKVATEAAAGRYIVLHDADSGEDYVYMHMSAVDVSVGDAVERRRERRRGRSDGRRDGLPPALRGVDRAGLVRRRSREGPAARSCAPWTSS